MFEFIIKGVVQGVGFRPFVYCLACDLGVSGYIQNIGCGVRVLSDRENFIDEIKSKLPVLARIDSVEVLDSNGESCSEGFEIRDSEVSNSYSSIPADLNVCNDCLGELFDEDNFRAGYFFISCTNCGPRFSIVKDMPYDREKTSLAKFKMCEGCLSEYGDFRDRRYHAQTIACKNCGPRLDLYVDGVKFVGDVIEEVSRLIKSGEIVSIKGVGGFHLACRPDENVILRLKNILGRKYKPLALMGKDIEMIEEFCRIGEKEREVLTSRERPIVLLEKREPRVMEEVSELSSLGFMLPYSPVHYLLFESINFPLVVTSSNLSSLPVSTKRKEQFVRYVLDYNREIVNFVDDSVVKVIGEKPLLIRRSRGFIPNEILLPDKYRCSSDFLAVGAEMKNCFCLKKKGKIIISQHIGNTFGLENMERFRYSVDWFLNFTKTDCDFVLCDFNKEFNVSLFARDFAKGRGVKCFDVLHHVAHGFSVALEHNLDNFLSVVCDGVGLGDDDNVWGGEVFHNDERIGRLEYQDLIGGDVANREPVRMLAGILSGFLQEDEIIDFLGEESRIWLEQKKEFFNCVKSSSCGRILDCVAVLLGLSSKNFYGGRGAMLLESNSKECEMFFEPKIFKGEDGLNVLDTSCLVKFIYENLDNIDKEKLAYFAQVYLVRGLFEIAKMHSNNLPICFSGGCAYNRFMTKFMIDNRVLLNKNVPCGDGGICVGQVGYWIWKNRG